MNGKITKQLPSQKSQPAETQYPKTDSRYWMTRIFKPVSGRGQESSCYSMQLMFKGKRMAFGLNCAEKELASKKAAGIFLDLVRDGIEATLLKHRPQAPEKPVTIATVGEYIAAAQKVFSGSPRTIGGYAITLRRVAGDIQGTLKTHKRFKPGGKTDFRKSVDAISLDILTPENIQAWRLAHVAKADKNPAAQKSARITANSILRQARSLFGKKITKYITGLTLPDPLPFNSVEFYPLESMKYQSKIDPATLLQTAASELQKSDPFAFLVMLLAIGCGLRRGEIDRLLWRQINFTKGVIHLEVTEASELKSSESQGDVPFDEQMAGILRGFRAQAQANSFVVPGNAEGMASRGWGIRYRAQTTFDRLNAWLRENGVNTRTPLHTLRKEAGSLIATTSGIHAASRFLRHADIGITAAIYADFKERVTVPISSFLTSESVIPFPEKAVEPKPAKKAKRKTATS